MRVFDGSGPTVIVNTNYNGQMMYSNETEIDPDYSFGTSEQAPFDLMTGSSHLTIIS